MSVGDAIAGALGVVAAVVVFLLGANTLGRPARGNHPGRPDRPPEPPRPDTSRLDREEAVADHEAARVRDDVDGATGHGRGGEDNPHGLADAVNRRRGRP